MAIAAPGLTRRQVLEQLRTKEILTAARRVIAAKGLAAATMDEIAETAGLAKGTIYLYFRNKQELFQAVVSEVLGRLVASLEDISRRPEPAGVRLAQMLHLLLATLEAEEDCFRVFSSEFPVLHFYLDHGAQAVRELDQQLTAALATVIRQGMAAGEFVGGDAQQIAQIVRGMVRAVALQKLVEGRPASLLEAYPLLKHLVFAGLRRGTTPPAGEVE